MKPASMAVEIAGHPLVLSSLRACFDPVLRCLFIADAHFGKDAVFRARGIPVPVGSTADNLMRLDILIAGFEPLMIVFLGDLLHARESHAQETLDALIVWRARHAGLRLVLVEGNHDRHAGALPVTFGVEYVQEPWRIGPWALCHYPQRVDGAYALAGSCASGLSDHDADRFGACALFPVWGRVRSAAGFWQFHRRGAGGRTVAGESVFLVVQERVIGLGRVFK